MSTHDAFRDAELCATARDEAFSGASPFDVALGHYWQPGPGHAKHDQEVHTMSARTTTAPPGTATGAVRTGAMLMAVAVAGFIAATGLAVLLLAVYGARSGQAWAWVAAVAAPVLGLAIALPAHYPWNLDTLGHLGFAYLATLVFVAGARLSGKGLLDARATRP